MLRPRVKITFTKADNSTVNFTFLNNFGTNESYQNLTDTLTITTPRKYQTMQGKDLFGGVNPIFQRNDKVLVECGYYPNQRTVFNGYIKAVNANIPIYIECEDNMFLLKKDTFNIPAKIPLITKSKKGKYLKRPKVNIEALPDYKLKDLLNIIIPDEIEFKVVDDVTITNLRVSNATPCKILEKLRDVYGLWSYFVGNVLYVGFANDAQDTVEQELDFETQVINSNELFYKRADEISIKVAAISINSKTNAKTTVNAGDDEGEQRTYHYVDQTEAQLKVLAESRLKEVVYTGYFGTIETFLEPYVKHGDRVKITSKKLPERNGVYLVKSVRRAVAVESGGRQFIELGVKVG